MAHARLGPESAEIRQMFDHLAPRYDLFNFLTGLGMAPLWRQKTLQFLKPGMKVLDIGCGTGDMALIAAKKTGPSGEVAAVDFSERMLKFAQKRARKTQSATVSAQAPIHWVVMKAEDLPLKEVHYDAVVSGFVLRNLYENIDRILQGAWRSLKTGGRVSFLDFTEPPNPVLRLLWRFYMNTAAAFYGRILFGKDYPDFYLTDSAKRFLKPADFTERLVSAGFTRVKARFMMFGIIVVYEGFK